MSFVSKSGVRELRGPGGEKLAYDSTDVRVLPPLQNPEKSFVIGFSDRARTEALPPAEIPTGYYKLPQTFVTTGAPVIWPKFSEELDADGCIAIVIGKAGKRIPPEKAWEHVAGAMLIVDITARDINKREGLTTNNLLGKNFPSSTCVAPALLVGKDKQDLLALEVELSLDGSVKQKFALRDCVFTVEQIIARWSILGIKPGDWLAIGASMALQGDRLQNPVPLKIGSTIRCAIAGHRRTVTPSCCRGRYTPMKLVTFFYDEQERIGAIDHSGNVVDLINAYASYLRKVDKAAAAVRLAAATLGSDMIEFLKHGDKALDAARIAIKHAATDSAGDNVVERQRVRLMAPVPRPGALISAGKNFSDHVAEMSSKKGPVAPVAFLKLPGSVIGPEDDIPDPPEVKNLDYEVELAVIIGKPCVDVSEGEALNYVAGYASFNDISARDIIRGENKNGIHLMGKSFPGFAPMGPYLVTADEIPDPQNLKLWLRVNGETRQDSNLGYMIFKIRDMIAYWSQMGLNPGDVLTTGTPRGVAAGRKPDQVPWWLKPGDLVEAEVEGLGCLRNRIVAE